MGHFFTRPAERRLTVYPMDPHVAEENIQALEQENSVEHHDVESTVNVVSSEQAEELSHPSEEVEELTEEELAKQELLNSWKEEQGNSILDEVEHQLQASEEEKSQEAAPAVVEAEVPPAHTIIETIEQSNSEEVAESEDIPEPLAAQPDTASSSDHIVAVPVVGQDTVDSTFREGEDVKVIENPRSVPLATTESAQQAAETVQEKAEEKVEEASSAVAAAEEQVAEKKEEAVDAVKSAAQATEEKVVEKKEQVAEKKEQAAAVLNAAEEKVKSAASTAAKKVDNVVTTVKKEVQSVPQSQWNWGLVITGAVACTVVGGLI